LLGRLARPVGPVLAALWYAMIFGVSSRPSLGRPGPITGNWMLNTGHSLLFGLLALCLVVAAPREKGWPVLRRFTGAIVLGLVLVLGLLDELHQSTVPGRTMAISDVLTDLTGASCVLWICAYAGSASARETGLRLRLLACLAACFLAGGFATWTDRYLQ
jgi:VanZ family protein